MDKSKHTVTIPVADYETMINNRSHLDKFFRIAKQAESDLEKINSSAHFERSEVSRIALYKIIGRIPID